MVAIAVLDTYVVGFCADKVWDGLRVFGCVGGLAIAAGAVKSKSVLIMRVNYYSCILSGYEARRAYSITVVC